MTPDQVDLRPNVDNVEDQGSVGMCVAEGTHKAVEVAYERNGGDLKLSPFYLYYYARQKENFYGSEGIRFIGDAAQTLIDRGCCLESSWPSTNSSMLAVVPPATLDDEAAQYKIKSWQYIERDADTIRTYLAKGMAVTIGINLTQDFWNLAGQKDWRTSFWNPVIDQFKNPFAGQHCVMIIGYDDAVQRYLVQNSWGPEWADGGFFGIPYSALLSICTQCAVIDDPGVPLVNAGWKEDTIVTFDRLLDWAEKTYGLAHAATQRFAQYLYRNYGDVDVGLDQTRGEIVRYTVSTNVFEDLGTFKDWLKTAGMMK